MNQAIYPLLVMLFLPFIVLGLTFISRVGEMKENRIHPQSISLRSDSSTKLKNTKAADNLLNLFETPVIFYVIGILFLIYKNATLVTVILMWIYVFSRYVHSYIHCTYNKVMHRFYAFFFSLAVLLLLLCNFAINL
jgi:hypothetical protein